jgi:hypothetical protein
MFRAFQGWLSMSQTGPGEGTLQVRPNVALSEAYTLLRPFFRSVRTLTHKVDDRARREFLDESNWEFTAGEGMTSDLQGATPGHGQEFPSFELHPHLELDRTMMHIPRVNPGDYVVWHCDSKFGHVTLSYSWSSVLDLLGRWLMSLLLQPSTQLTRNTREHQIRASSTFLSVQPPKQTQNTWHDNGRAF